MCTIMFPTHVVSVDGKPPWHVVDPDVSNLLKFILPKTKKTSILKVKTIITRQNKNLKSNDPPSRENI